jgi:phosphoglucosamine mutase
MTIKLFGTDGVRGLANIPPISCDIVQKFGLAAGYYFGRKPGHRSKVVIAKDTRLSGYMVESALMSGFIAAGVDVLLVGPMPTPAVPFLIKALRADIGVMISASHNPHHDNGLKLFGPDGYKISDVTELKLQELIFDKDLSRAFVAADMLGRAKRLDDAIGRYTEHVKRSFPRERTLEGMKIVIDCANGAAYNVAPTVLWELGAEVIKLGVEPDGFNINHHCGSMHPETLCQSVLEHRADIGIALDGDADRLVVCDQQGQIVHGDHLIGLIGAHLHKTNQLSTPNIIVTQISNGALEDYFSSMGISITRVSVGDRHVSAMMRKVGSNFGGEQSGHIVMSDYASTGDGIVAALQLLAIITSTPGVEISKVMRPFNLKTQISHNVRYQGNNPLANEQIKNQIAAITNAYAERARILVRASGTEKLVRIMVESEDEEMLKVMALIEQLLTLE